MNKSSLSPKTTTKGILGFSWPIFLLVILILILNFSFGYFLTTTTIYNKAPIKWELKNFPWHNIMDTLLFAMIMAAILNFIGNKLPILKDIGGGSVLCILFPSFILSYKFSFLLNYHCLEILRNTIIERMRFFNKDSGVGFSSFFVSCLIIGNLLNMDIQFLKRTLKKFLPLVLISLLVGAVITSCFGWILTTFGYSPINKIADHERSELHPFLSTLYYIFVPLSSGGMTAGIVPLKATFSSALVRYGALKGDVGSDIFPALLIGGIFSIFVAGIMKKLFAGTKYSSGSSQLEKNSTKASNKRLNKNNVVSKVIDIISYTNIRTGLIMIFTFYAFSSFTRNLLKLIVSPKYTLLIPETIVFVVFIVIIAKFLNFVNDYYLNCVQQASKLVTTNFVSALLVILGCTLDISQAASHFYFPFILTCCCSVLTVSITAFIVGQCFNFYAFESAITAGLCVNSIGGAGNINILMAAELMPLSQFSQISTRLGGAIVVFLASLTYPLIISML